MFTLSPSLPSVAELLSAQQGQNAELILNDNQHQTEHGRAARFSIPGAQTLGPQRPAPDEGGGGWRGVSERGPPEVPQATGPNPARDPRGSLLPFQVHLISAEAANLSCRQVLSCHSL